MGVTPPLTFINLRKMLVASKSGVGTTHPHPHPLMMLRAFIPSSFLSLTLWFLGKEQCVIQDCFEKPAVEKQAL